ncbi:hypothetical protein KCU62_g7507, partial [Aureobasidium sp. EXF-3399]
MTQPRPNLANVIELLYSVQMPLYKYNGPISCDVDFDRSGLQGKTAIVTGASQGANGIGERYVRALVRSRKTRSSSLKQLKTSHLRVFSYDASGPREPDLKVVDVNLKGVLYTSKLATHYFISQNGKTETKQQEDTCLILIGSGAAFLDCPRSPQYQATKYVGTKILSKEAFDHVKSFGS